MANVSSSNGLEKRPKLRFPGFDKPWNTALLSDYFVKSTKKNSDGMISNVICNSAKQGLIPQREYFDKDIANSDNTNGYYIIESNDFVYNPRKSADAPYGPISSYQYSEAGIVSPLYLCFRAKREINPLYFEWYFRSSAWHRYIYMSGDSGARHDRVSIKDDVFFAMPINVPSAKEQERISLFLDAIERRIETQRTLVETLKKYKRGVISALLSSKTNPYYSSETWKEVALCDVASGFEYGMNAAATVYDGSHKYIRITDIDDNSHLYSQDVPVSPEGQVDEKYRVRENDILFARTGASVGKSYCYQRSDGDLYYAGFLIRIHVNSDVNCGYVFQNTLTEAYRRWVLLESARSGQPGINAEQYKQYRFLLPPLELQNKISTLATNLDNLICKEENLLSQIEQVKIALLQRLFI